MKLTVKIVGSLFKPEGKTLLAWEGPQGSTIEQVLLNLGYAPEHLRFLTAAVNGVSVPDLDAKPPEGAVVLISMPIGGG